MSRASSRGIDDVPEGGRVPREDDDAGTFALDPANVLPRRIAAWAERDPDRVLFTEVGGASLSYGETVERVRRWASWLRALGVGPGDRVLSMLPASFDTYLLWMAASCVGACEVPVNPELRGTFLRHALTDAGARLCLARPEFARLPASVGADGLQVIEVPRDIDVTAGLSPLDVDWPAPEDTACVIYTSGTTGPAKGVEISWAQMSATVGRIPRSWLSEGDAVYCCHAAFHVTGRSPLPSMAEVGGRVVLRERFSLHEFWDDVRRYQCTSTTAFVPLLLGLPEREDDRDHPLRVVLCGAPPEQIRRFSERFGVPMIACYGSTEAGFPLALRRLEGPLDGKVLVRDLGRLRRGYAARIVDEAGQDLPDGSPGELWIRPPERRLMARGYLGLPEKTREAFADGWYRTGDAMVRHPDGRFEFVDRLKDTIRRHGENISSSALEASVCADAEVQECAALGVPDPVAGHEVLLVVAPPPGVEIERDAFLSRLAEQLPRYMQPAYLAVVDASDLPRTPTNKIRKTALLEAIDLEAVRVRTKRAPNPRR